jgi:HSP20 family molecular chaperone IbpA
MWDEAVALLMRAERLHDRFFQPAGGARRPCWEPPIDVLETDREVVILAAVPGVHEQALAIAIEGPQLVISGERVAPPEMRSAVIHRLELPQGRFERRVPLPAGRYDKIAHLTEHGCLVIRLRKAF